MDEREIAAVAAGVRRSLGTLDELAVPDLASVRSRRARVGARSARGVGALAAAALVVVLAVLAGDALNAWRTERAAAPTGTAAPAIGSAVAADDRHGLLVRLADGKSTALVDELGRQLTAPLEGVVEAKTSPDGRYVAVLQSFGTRSEIRVVDGVSRSVSAPLFTTAERRAANHSFVWASDSSAITIATTADPIASNTAPGPPSVTLRAVDLAGKSRAISTYQGYSLTPLGWDRTRNVILAYATTAPNGPARYLRFPDGGSNAVVSFGIADAPIAANDAGTIVASAVSCDDPATPATEPPCKFAIHDAVTYDTIAQIAIPPTATLLSRGNDRMIDFRPRSSDVIVYYLRAATLRSQTFAVELHANDGRGARRDLGDVVVGASAQGTFYQPDAVIRADGSALFYAHATGAGAAAWSGDLVDLASGAHAPATLGWPMASVILDPALVLGARPVATPQVAVGASVTREQAIALVRGLGEVARADRIEAKLVPWNEFAPVGMGVDRSGGPAHGGGTPAAVWAVAVAGDVYPDLGDLVAKRHYAWALYGINATRPQVSTLKVGDTGTWPPGFDALADHVAVAPPTAVPSEAIPFDHLTAGPRALRMRIDDITFADPDATHLWAVVDTGERGANELPITALMRSDDGGADWDRVDGVTGSPFHVAAAGSIVLVSDYGYDTASDGTSTSGGLYVSKDAGTTWKRVTSESVGRLFVARYQGRVLFLADHMWATKGAASGPSRIYGSSDGEAWRELGEVPGPATFGMLDVPLVAYSKNLPGDGVFRVEGASFESLHLAAIAGSGHVGGAVLTTAPGSQELWAFAAGGAQTPLRSPDGFRTWEVADAGLAGRIAGLFVWHGKLYAIGDGAFQWDGSRWQPAVVFGPKATAVFQLGSWVIIQQGSDPPYRSPR